MKNIRKMNCQYLSHCTILGRFQANVLPSLINYSKEAPTSFLANQYYKLLLRVKVVTQNIWFSNYCLNHSLTPQHMKLKSANASFTASKGIRSGIISSINTLLNVFLLQIRCSRAIYIEHTGYTRPSVRIANYICIIFNIRL